MFVPNQSQFLLSLSQVDQAGQDTAVFIAIAISDHDLPDGVLLPFSLADRFHAAFRYRVFQELLIDLRTILEVVHRLKKGNHRQWTVQSVNSVLKQSNFASQQIDNEQV